MNILAFFNNYPIYTVPNRFSYQHILLLLLDAIIFFIIIYFFRKKDKKVKRNILIIINIICIIIFAGRMFFGWEGSRLTGDGTKNTLLPLELCNINIIVSLVALIVNKRFMNNYMYFVTMIAACIPLLVFPDCHMITNGNTLFHYMFLDFWFIHSSLVLIPLAMLCWGFFVPDYHSIPGVILLILGIYFFDFIVSSTIKNIPCFAGANYMYCLYDNNLPILRELHRLIPYPFLYGLPLVIPVSGLFYLMSLPFKKKKEK